MIVGNNLAGLISFRGELVQQLIQRGNTVAVLVPKPVRSTTLDHESLNQAELMFIPLDARGTNVKKEWAVIRNIATSIRQFKPDVILTYTIKPNLYINLITRGKIPVIMNITGMGSKIHSSKSRAIFMKLYQLAGRYSHRVMFQNSNSLDFFLNHGLLEREKAELIPGSGVNLEKFPYHPLPKTDEIRFLFVGRLMRDKGIREYLQAASIILKTHPNVLFDVVGEFVENVEGVKDYENIPGIHFYPFSTDVRSLYESHHCIVNPSYHEGMSNVLLEAAATGRPLLASAIPGCREIVEEASNGFLFEPRSSQAVVDAMEKILALNVANWTTMGQRSRKLVEEKFDRQIIIDKYVELIDQIS